MKKLISAMLLVGSLSQANALSPQLNSTMELFEACMAETNTPLCDDNFEEMISELKLVNLDARGEFVYVLKDVLNKESNEAVVVNLYEKLQVLAPVYTQLDGTSAWSGRDILGLLGQVSVSYIQYVAVDAKELEALFVQQATPTARYNFVGALHKKADNAKDQGEIEELISFGVFAKDYIKSKGDEYYIYQSAVELIKKLTIQNLRFVVGFEGVYEIKLLNEQAQQTLKIDNVVISSSDAANGLLVNFVSSQFRATKMAFKGAGLLGNQAFSNEKVFINSNEIAAPGFKFDIDFENKELKGSFFSKRFGAVEFVGKQKVSNARFYNDISTDSVALENVVGNYPVKVGNFNMTLKIERNGEQTELALINNNALIVFSNVTFNKEFNVVKGLDWQLSRMLELKLNMVNDELVISGQFTNSATAKVLEVSN